MGIAYRIAVNASFTALRRMCVCVCVAAIGAVAPPPLPSCLTVCTAHQCLYTHSGCIDPTPDNRSWHAYMLLSLSETSVPISLAGHCARHQAPRRRTVVPCIRQWVAILPLHPKACPAQVDLADRAAPPGGNPSVRPLGVWTLERGRRFNSG